MKLTTLIAPAALALSLGACATTSQTTDASTQTAEATIANAKPEKGLAQVFETDIKAAMMATRGALEKYGFEITEESDDGFEAKRKSKVGVFVGSGGEKMIVKFDEADAGTRVHVRTKKTLVGIAGQKNWDDEVMSAITDSIAAMPNMADVVG